MKKGAIRGKANKLFIENFTGASCKVLPEGRYLLTYTYNDRTIQRALSNTEYSIYQRLEWAGKAAFWLRTFKITTDYKKSYRRNKPYEKS
jgi:hypothetical protein